jgi:hypothetical protein
MVIKQSSRIKHHTLSTTGSTLFTIAPSNDPTDGTWTPTDLLPSEFGVKSGTKQLFMRFDDEIRQIVTTSQSGSTFSGLTVGGPINSVQYNNGSGLAGVSGFTFDETNTKFNLETNYGKLQLGDVDYAGVPISGTGLSYINPLSANTMISGVFFGDANDGNGDYAASFGFRNIGTPPIARNYSAYQDRVEIISKSGTTGYGIEMNNVDFVIDKDGNNKIAINTNGDIVFYNAYKFPQTAPAVNDSHLISSSAGTLSWQAPKRYTNYFDFSSSTVTTIAVADTWYKLSADTTQGFSNNGLIHTDNRITNSGSTGIFKIEGVTSLQSTDNNVLAVAFFKNGVLIPCSEQKQVVVSHGGSDLASAIPFQCLTQLDPSDYLEVYVKNMTAANNVTIDNLNVIITEY